MIDFESDRRFLSVVFSRGVEIPKWAVLQIMTALPSDALLFHVDFAFQENQYHLVFWSADFDPVPAGLGDFPADFMAERTATAEA